MLLVSKRLFNVMFRCMDKNDNKFPEWMNNRLKEVYNPFAD